MTVQFEYATVLWSLTVGLKVDSTWQNLECHGYFRSTM